MVRRGREGCNDEIPYIMTWKHQMIVGNGVPFSMGLAIAKAVKRALA